MMEEAPVDPIELTLNGKELCVVNLPDASVSVFETDFMTLQHEIPVGLGPVSIRRLAEANRGHGEEVDR